MRIQHTFTQKYSNWESPIFVDNFEARVDTFDILEHMDSLEPEVYKDREFTLANELIEKARSR